MSIRPVIVVLLLVALAACDRRVDPWVPPEDEPPSEGPVRVPGLASPPARSESPLSGAPGGAPVRGTLRLSGGAGGAGSGTLFVIARSADGGPPLAVKRLPAGPFPLDFEIGPHDGMMPGRPFAGPIRLSARLDRDGDPLTRGTGDLEAALAQSIQPGAAGLELVLGAGGVPSAPMGGAAAPIRGILRLLEGAATAGEGVVFVIARSPGGGPPLAVRRLPAGPFPLEFEIGPGDVMMPGRTFEGPILLSARLDRYGDALTREAADLAASLPGSVHPGATGLVLELAN